MKRRTTIPLHLTVGHVYEVVLPHGGWFTSELAEVTEITKALRFDNGMKMSQIDAGLFQFYDLADQEVLQDAEIVDPLPDDNSYWTNEGRFMGVDGRPPVRADFALKDVLDITGSIQDYPMDVLSQRQMSDAWGRLFGWLMEEDKPGPRKKLRWIARRTGYGR